MPKYVSIILLAITIFIACDKEKPDNDSAPENVKPFTSDSSISTVSVSRDGEDWIVTTTETDYRFLPELKPDSKESILLKISKAETKRGKEIEASDYHVEGFLWNGESFNQKAWEVEQDAVELEITSGLLQFKQSGHKYGDETGNDTYFLYSLKSGKQIVDYTYDRLSVNIMTKPQGLRFLTYSARLTAGDSYEQFKADSSLVGIVRYSNEEGVIEEIYIRVKSMDSYDLIPPYTPTIEIFNQLNGAQLINYNKNLLLWPTDKAISAEEISGFGIKITYYVGQTYRPVEVIIPIVNDAIDPNGIIFDDNLFQLSLNQL